MKGRRRKTKAQRRLDGSRGKPKKTGKRTAVSKTTCPKYLSQAAKTEWRRLEAELYANGKLTKETRQTFAAYCEAVSTLRLTCKAEQEWLKNHKGNAYYLTRSGVLKRIPMIADKKEAIELVKKIAAEMGITPASFSRVPTFEKEEEFDELAEFMNPTEPDSDEYPVY